MKLLLSLMRPLHTMHEISFPEDAGLSKLWRQLQHHISCLKKGKCAEIHSETCHNKEVENYSKIVKENKILFHEWPKVIPKSLKDKIILNFCQQTLNETLCSFVCTVCSEQCLIHKQCQVSSESVDLNLLHCLDRCLLDEKRTLHWATGLEGICQESTRSLPGLQHNFKLSHEGLRFEIAQTEYHHRVWTQDHYKQTTMAS